MMEFYSALKRNEVVIHAMTRMNWKQYMLSEITQTYKATYVRFHLHKTSRIGKSTKPKVNWWFPGSEKKDGWGMSANRCGVFWGDRNVLELDGGDSYTTFY